jgi:L-lactate dehydrogenase
MTRHYPARQLQNLASDIFVAAGLERSRAELIARGFLEADLMGFSTHGLSRVPANVKWLESGTTRAHGEPVVLYDAPAAASWDACFLPGPYVMHVAIDHAAQRASQQGVYLMTLRRAQHIACLASYLVPIVELGLVGIIMASTPDEAFVSPFKGRTPLFSNNPIAFCAPTSADPVLFDVSTAVTAGGQVARAAREGRQLPEACLKDASGRVTADPTVLGKGGSVMPVGGEGHGHKGYALTVLTEILTQVLAGYGRGRGAGDGEANSVLLQIIDPRLIAGHADYLHEMDYLLESIRNSAPDDADEPVRVPGERSWSMRRQRLAEGVDLYPGVFEGLLAQARRLGVDTDLVAR